MNITEQLGNNIKQAMRDKQTIKLNALRALKAAIETNSKDVNGKNDHLPIIRRLIKQRADSAEVFTKGGRLELAEKEKLEIAVLTAYLPLQLTDEEIAALVQAAIARTGSLSIRSNRMGAAMKFAVEEAAGRVDSKTLSNAIKSALETC